MEKWNDRFKKSIRGIKDKYYDIKTDLPLYGEELQHSFELCVDEVLNLKRSNFFYKIKSFIEKGQSQIEVVFGMAMLINLHKNFLNVIISSDSNISDYYVFDNDAQEISIIESQHKIDEKYVCDFCITHYRDELDGNFTKIKIIIECDGHEYHEKTKEQALKDKKRDRFIQGMGYKVLRFTGSEIWKDVFSCTKQVLDILQSELNRVDAQLIEISKKDCCADFSSDGEI